MAEEREKLYEEVKILRKINREQEKGLVELTHDNYIEMMREFE
jgi:hypothetical protein